MSFAIENEFIRPKDLGVRISVDPRIIIDILKPFCEQVTGKGWHLRKPPDEYFIQNQIQLGGKDYVKLYLSSWQKNRNSIIEDLNKSNDKVEAKVEEQKGARRPSQQAARAGLSVAFAETRKPEEKELLQFVFYYSG